MIQEAVSIVVQTIVQALLALLSLTFPFIVGDSTVAQTTINIGYGSGFPGHGYTMGFTGELVNDFPILSDQVVNPLLLPDNGYDGPVVLTVSLWDRFSDDLTPYQDAVDHYKNAGYNVIVVEVPENVEADVRLNQRVALSLIHISEPTRPY